MKDFSKFKRSGKAKRGKRTLIRSVSLREATTTAIRKINKTLGASSFKRKLNTKAVRFI